MPGLRLAAVVTVLLTAHTRRAQDRRALARRAEATIARATGVPHGLPGRAREVLL